LHEEHINATTNAVYYCLQRATTCLECALVTKRSSRLGIPDADQTVCGQSANKTPLLSRNILVQRLVWFVMV